MEYIAELVRGMSYEQFIAFVATIAIPWCSKKLSEYSKHKEDINAKVQAIESKQAVINAQVQLELNTNKDMLKELKDGQERMITRLEAKLDSSVSELRGIVIQEIRDNNSGSSNSTKNTK